MTEKTNKMSEKRNVYKLECKGTVTLCKLPFKDMTGCSLFINFQCILKSLKEKIMKCTFLETKTYTSTNICFQRKVLQNLLCQSGVLVTIIPVGIIETKTATDKRTVKR